MPNKCCVPGCRSNYDNFKTLISTFKFPKGNALKEKWLKAINRQDFTPTTYSVVCEKHFAQQFIIREDRMTRADGTVIVAQRSRPALTKDAYPSYFPNPALYPSTATPLKRISQDKQHARVAAKDEECTENWMKLSARFFYEKNETVFVPVHPAISDDEGIEEEDDNAADSDFILPAHNLDTQDLSNEDSTAKRKCVWPAVEVLQDEDDDGDEDQPVRQAKKSSKKRKAALRVATWKKVDLKNPLMPDYQHSPPDFMETPFQHFSRYFSSQVIRHITYQTNLYATQKDVNTTFTTTEDEMMNFIAILIYMGIAEMPSVDDYWAMETRVPQVANIMSSKRFKLIKRLVHFDDNTQFPGTIDRFYKIRPLFNFLNTAFRSVPQTPKQSVYEVMVAYKGKNDNNLRQYINNKPEKWGFKLFARASEDGFIHDMVLYQGKTSLAAHGVPLTPEQEAMGPTSQIVSVLASTMSSSTTTTIFANNYFTSLEIVRHLKDKNCRYTGTARDNKIGKTPLKSITEMEKKDVSCGTCDYVTSNDGVLALRWKGNKIITLLSTDMGVEPMCSVNHYCSDTKREEEVSCPTVIKRFNASMRGIEISDMLVQLYRTPMKSKRWYLQLFAYAIDVSLTNAWVIYKRDCKALAVESMSLKDFRIQVYRNARSQKSVTSHSKKSSGNLSSFSTSVDVPKPVQRHCKLTPDDSVRFDLSLFHAPAYTTCQTCKYCSRTGHFRKSNVVCSVCKVNLCLNAERNCFIKYHESIA